MKEHVHFCVDHKIYFQDNAEGCPYPFNYSCMKEDYKNGDW